MKLVGTRDVYMATFPKSIDVVPEYVGGIVDFLNAHDNGANAKPITHSDPQQSITDAQPLLKKAGITLLDPSAATDTNAFFVTKKYSEDNNVTKLSDLKGKSVVLAAAPDCQGRARLRGRPHRQVRHQDHQDPAARLRQPQTYKSVLDGESQLGETSTTDATLDSQGLVLLEDDKKIQPAQNLVPGGLVRLPRRAPRRRRAAQRADGRADDREPDRAQRRGVGRPQGPAGSRRPVPVGQRPADLSRFHHLC